MRLLSGVMAVLLIFVCVNSYAEDGGKVDKWLRELTTMVEKIVPKKTETHNTTAVSGVRSADQRRDDQVYWRGKKENITEDEISEFKAALESAQQGQKEEAINKFREFIRQHPQSGLSRDAETTIEKLNAS